MTPADRNNEFLEEKLEWVTPKISLMGAEDTEGKSYQSSEARGDKGYEVSTYGPS